MSAYDSVPTANDRLKQGFGRRIWTGIAVAAVAHFLLFSFWPSIQAADYSYDARALEAVDMPPEIDIPPPPEQIMRPATPVISASADVSEDVTIAPTTFADNPIDALPPPPEPEEVDAMAEYEAFTSAMIRPEVRNRAEVAERMRRLYPSSLRNAGVGGITVLEIWLDDTGAVQQTTVARSSGYPQLDEASLEVIDYVEFTPALNRDRRVKVRLSWPIQWQPQ